MSIGDFGLTKTKQPVMTAKCHVGTIFVTVFAFLISCTFTFDVDNKPLSFNRIASDADTLPVRTRITGVFSTPIIDSTVEFDFTPSFTAITTQINPGHDTFVITTTALLEGNTRYLIKPRYTIRAQNGQALIPDHDSIVFFTRSREEEPNNSPLLCDTLRDMICGTISSVNDTDYYFYLPTKARAVVSRSWESSVRIGIRDTNNLPISTGRIDQISDTLPLNTTPCFIVVTPSQRVTAGYYELWLLY